MAGLAFARQHALGRGRKRNTNSPESRSWRGRATGKRNVWEMQKGDLRRKPAIKVRNTGACQISCRNRFTNVMAPEREPSEDTSFGGRGPHAGVRPQRPLLFNQVKVVRRRHSACRLGSCLPQTLDPQHLDFRLDSLQNHKRQTCCLSTMAVFPIASTD